MRHRGFGLRRFEPGSKALFAPRQSRKTVSAAAFSGILPTLLASID
jgi:hypothetical protein